MKKGIENNLRWLFMKSAFEGSETPQAFLIGHALMGVSAIVGSDKGAFITNKEWEDFSMFCNLCDTIACLRREKIPRMSCLSMWMSYEQGKARKN